MAFFQILLLASSGNPNPPHIKPPPPWPVGPTFGVVFDIRKGSFYHRLPLIILGGFDYIQGIWWENHGKSIAKPRPVVPIAENYQSRRQGSPKISIDRLLNNSRLAPQE